VKLSIFYKQKFGRHLQLLKQQLYKPLFLIWS